jgi:hypothetical protein
MKKRVVIVVILILSLIAYFNFEGLKAYFEELKNRSKEN